MNYVDFACLVDTYHISMIDMLCYTKLYTLGTSQSRDLLHHYVGFFD